MCIITTWIIQLAVELEASAAGEFLKSGWDPPGWVLCCVSCVDTIRVLQGGSHLWMACDPIQPQSRASLGVGWANARPDSEIFSMYRRQTHSVSGPLVQGLTTLLEKNVRVPLTRVGSNVSIAPSHPAEDWTDLCWACSSPGKQPLCSSLCLCCTGRPQPDKVFQRCSC